MYTEDDLINAKKMCNRLDDEKTDFNRKRYMKIGEKNEIIKQIHNFDSKKISLEKRLRDINEIIVECKLIDSIISNSNKEINKINSIYKAAVHFFEHAATDISKVFHIDNFIENKDTQDTLLNCKKEKECLEEEIRILTKKLNELEERLSKVNRDITQLNENLRMVEIKFDDLRYDVQKIKKSIYK